ncbi:MAG: MFS transporter, partial [Alphaproteobacteria bacterium]|nr:MFS transporter [Alphaproteobacteria bacterium]
QQHIRPYTADYNISPENTGLIISAMAGTMIVGKIIVGALSDSWDHRLLYWLTVASMMVGVFLMIGVPDFTLVLIAAVFLGFGGGGILPLMGSIFASRFGPMAFGRVLGIAGPFITLSSIGPPLTGFLRDTTGAYDEALLYLLLLTIPSVVIMAFLQPAHKMRTLNGEAAAPKAAE